MIAVVILATPNITMIDEILLWLEDRQRYYLESSTLYAQDGRYNEADEAVGIAFGLELAYQKIKSLKGVSDGY